MGPTIRVSLPTYDVLTETDLDHFALYADADNVLIKELARGNFNITGDGSEVTQTITHNLGYIPFFLVYVLDVIDSKWKLLAHNTAGASVPSYIAYVDIANLYVINFLAAISGAVSFKYFIFYDDINGGGSPSITESDQVLKVSKTGVNALNSLNPNDYIFHSDLNTFKILKEANGTISYTTDGVYTFNHNAPISNPSAYMVFVKFPDGYTSFLPGKGVIFSKNSAYNISNSYIDSTQIGMTIGGGGVANTLNYKYYVFETPLA